MMMKIRRQTEQVSIEGDTHSHTEYHKAAQPLPVYENADDGDVSRSIFLQFSQQLIAVTAHVFVYGLDAVALSCASILSLVGICRCCIRA